MSLGATMQKRACAIRGNDKKSIRNNDLNYSGNVRFFQDTLKSVAVVSGAVLLLATTAQAEEPYNVDIDGTDAWTGSNVTNFLDVDSSISTEASALELQVNATVGSANGTAVYAATNANGDEEINVNIAAQTGQRAEIT